MKAPLCLSMDFLGPRNTSEVGWGLWWDVTATCFPLGPAVACDDPDGFPASLSALYLLPGEQTHTMVWMWKSEDILWELVLSFHHGFWVSTLGCDAQWSVVFTG